MWPCLCYPNNDASLHSGTLKPTKDAATSLRHHHTTCVAPNNSAAVDGDVAAVPCYQLGLSCMFFYSIVYWHSFLLLQSYHESTGPQTHPRRKHGLVVHFFRELIPVSPPSLQMQVSGILHCYLTYTGPPLLQTQVGGLFFLDNSSLYPTLPPNASRWAITCYLTHTGPPLLQTRVRGPIFFFFLQQLIPILYFYFIGIATSHLCEHSLARWMYYFLLSIQCST
jgi:hypothetical protein